MSNPNTGSGRRAPKTSRSRRGWWRMVRLGLVVLACTLAGTGQAQNYTSLDLALSRIIGEIVDDGELRGQTVLVSPNNFFEMGTGRHLQLSSLLARKSIPELRRQGARPVSGSEDEDRAVTLRGEWSIEHESGELYLFIEAKQLVGENERSTLASEQGYIPVTSIGSQSLQPDIESHGRYVVHSLERNVPSADGRYRLHVRPFTTQSMAEPDRFNRYLLGRWRPAFTDSRRFRLVGSTTRYDGELRGDIFVEGERIEISLYILDGQEQEVAAAIVEMDKGLFPRNIFGRDVSVELVEMDEMYLVMMDTDAREGPSMLTKNLGLLESGETINVTGKVVDKNWYQIGYRGNVAYVSSSHIQNLITTLGNRGFDFDDDEGLPLCNIQGTGESCNVKAFIFGEISNDRYGHTCKKLDQATYQGSCLNGKLNGLILLDADGSKKDTRQSFLGYFLKGRPLYPLVTSYAPGYMFSIREKNSSYGCVVFGEWDSSETRESCPKIKRNLGISMTHDVARSFFDGSFDLENTERRFLGRLLR